VILQISIKRNHPVCPPYQGENLAGDEVNYQKSDKVSEI